MNLVTRLTASLDRLEGAMLRNSARALESIARLEEAEAAGDPIAAKEARQEIALAHRNIGTAVVAIAKLAEAISAAAVDAPALEP